MMRMFFLLFMGLLLLGRFANAGTPGDAAMSVRVTGPAMNEILIEGQTMTLVVDDVAFPDWRSMEFFAGAQKLGEVSRARPARLTVSDLKTGVYAFSVLATDAKGVMRSSAPALVLVRKLPPAAP